MRGICGKLPLFFICLAHGLHCTTRKHIADSGSKYECQPAENRKCPRRLFHAVIHGGDIFADVNCLDRQRGAEHRLRCHHHLRRCTALVRLRKDAYFPLGRVPRSHDVQHKGLDAERRARKADEPSLAVEDIVEETIVRTAVELCLVRIHAGVKHSICLCLRHTIRRV